MKVRVRSGAERLADKADEEFGQLEDRIHDLVSQGARALREGDTYQDHSGHNGLRANTRADDESSGDEIAITLTMDKHYASYVNRLGFSGFDDVTEELRRQLRRGISAMGRRLQSR